MNSEELKFANLSTNSCSYEICIYDWSIRFACHLRVNVSLQYKVRA